MVQAGLHNSLEWLESPDADRTVIGRGRQCGPLSLSVGQMDQCNILMTRVQLKATRLATSSSRIPGFVAMDIFFRRRAQETTWPHRA